MTYQYDSIGNLTHATDGEQNTTSYTYDLLLRRDSQTDAGGYTTNYEYELGGNLKKLIDPRDNTTQWTYDFLDRTVQEENQFGDSRFYFHDLVDNVTETTDRNGRVTLFKYDDLYRLRIETWLDGSAFGRFTTDYDLVGNLTNATSDVSGPISYAFEYDSLYRLESETQTTPNTHSRFSQYYDLVGNLKTTITKRDIGSGPGGSGIIDSTTSYVLDNLYRVQQIQQTGEASDKTLDFAYNQANQLVDIRRYAALPDSNGNISGFVVHSKYGYDPAGRLAGITHAESDLGATDLTSAPYNSAQLWEGLSDSADSDVIAGYWFDYDNASRITAMDSFRDDFRVDYTYDARNQLTSAIYTSSNNAILTQLTEGQQYDANGNRLLDADNSQSDAGTNNQIQTDGTYDFRYDREGNRTHRIHIESRKITVYQWDHRNRMVSISEYTSFTEDGDTITPTGLIQKVQQDYDPFNQWIRREVDSDGDGVTDEATDFVHQGGQIVLQYEDTDGSGPSASELSNRYLWGPAVDQLLAYEEISADEAEVYWPLTDHLGSVRDVIDSDGNVRKHKVYNSFGEVTEETNYDASGAEIDASHSDAVDLIIGYTGRPLDAWTGLQNNLNRWYDAVTVTWVSQDPIGFAAGDSNLYRYVGNGPTNATDPNGLEKFRHSGHHRVPHAIYGVYGAAIQRVFDSPAGRIFDSVNSYYFFHGGGSYGGISHDAYNAVVEQKWCDFKKGKRVTATLARQFLQDKDVWADPILSAFNNAVTAERDEAVRVGNKIYKKLKDQGHTAPYDQARKYAKKAGLTMRAKLNAHAWAKGLGYRIKGNKLIKYSMKHAPSFLGFGGAVTLVSQGEYAMAATNACVSLTPLDMAGYLGHGLGWLYDAAIEDMEESGALMPDFADQGKLIENPRPIRHRHGVDISPF